MDLHDLTQPCTTEKPAKKSKTKTNLKATRHRPVELVFVLPALTLSIIGLPFMSHCTKSLLVGPSDVNNKCLLTYDANEFLFQV